VGRVVPAAPGQGGRVRTPADPDRGRHRRRSARDVPACRARRRPLPARARSRGAVVVVRAGRLAAARLRPHRPLALPGRGGRDPRSPGPTKRGVRRGTRIQALVGAGPRGDGAAEPGRAARGAAALPGRAGRPRRRRPRRQQPLLDQHTSHERAPQAGLDAGRPRPGRDLTGAGDAARAGHRGRAGRGRLRQTGRRAGMAAPTWRAGVQVARVQRPQPRTPPRH
jgi:hypothetical protein